MQQKTPADYLIVPPPPRGDWRYMPVHFSNRTGGGDPIAVLRGTEMFQFGVISSAMHMAWLRYAPSFLPRAAGVKPFPWPITHTPSQAATIETRALAVLSRRTVYAPTPLAELYHPAAMPPSLCHAHAELDAAVDAAYGQRQFASDQSRVEFLLALDSKIASLLKTGAPELVA